MLGHGRLKRPSHHMAMRSRHRRDQGLRLPRPPGTTPAQIVQCLCVELTTICRHKYHSEQPRSLRQLLATVRRLQDENKGYTYELAAQAVRGATRAGQPRYEWETIFSNTGKEGEVQEDILFNLTSTSMIARNGNSAASSINAPPPSIQAARPLSLQIDPPLVFPVLPVPAPAPAGHSTNQTVHASGITVVSTPGPTALAVPAAIFVEPGPHLYIMSFLKKHPGKWYKVSEFDPSRGSAAWDCNARLCIAEGAACYWDDSSAATCWPGGSYLSWPAPTGLTGVCQDSDTSFSPIQIGGSLCSSTLAL